MEKEFIVSVTETVAREYKVKARDKEQAKEKWIDGEFTGLELTIDNVVSGAKEVKE